MKLLVPKCNYNDVLISSSFSYYSSGFAIETEEDIIIQENNDLPRKIQCGTEKGKQKAKNHRTAGKQEIITVMHKKPFPVFHYTDINTKRCREISRQICNSQTAFEFSNLPNPFKVNLHHPMRTLQKEAKLYLYSTA